MTVNKVLRMKLRSDMCPASGEGFAGFVDTDVNFDGNGLPYIPGKRLKGCLRECGLDILSVDDSYSQSFEKLFGKTGKAVSSILKIGNGVLVEDNVSHEEIVSSLGDTHRSELAEVYTSIRSRTRMENGKAAPGTLRTARVLNKGQIYEFPLTLTEIEDEKDEKNNKLLDMCVKSLRAMGLNRSRGLGEIVCTIADKEEDGIELEIVDFGNKKSFSYIINLLQPVICAERSGKPLDSERFIFGSTILGAFAVRYMEKNRLSRENAYKDMDFRHLFLEGGVTFTAVMPFKDGSVYYPAPATLKTNKMKIRLSDDSGGIPTETDEDNPICKRLGGFISIEGGVVNSYNPEMTAFIHHARPDDRGKGRADKDDGKLFTYEALSEKQSFAGSVIGTEDDLKLLKDLFKDDKALWLGRSRTAQYGKAEILEASSVSEANSMVLSSGDEFRLVAVTPIILENEYGINTMDLSVLAKQLCANLEIVRFSCSETSVAGYYSKWLLPRGQERALAEGSVVVFKYNGTGALLKLNFVGNRTGEGFGQIRLEPIPKHDDFKLSADQTKSESSATNLVPPKIMMLQNMKNAMGKGAKYGEENFATTPSNSTLQRIVTELRASDDFEGFAEKLTKIQQDKQKYSALSFATDTPIFHFRSNENHLSADHIAALLAQRGYAFKEYGKFMTSAVHRIKQKRREKEAVQQEGGGDNSEKG